ncbi:polyamine aminopropyltransferase [Candidatus Kapabacteria bacterium]|nr:polyamine aminopropyltransferase [Candidatus Kapabacteria bacterium]
MKFRSNILKAAVFLSGFSGIVAEYVLSTLASYFLGNSLVQWAMIISVMLFSMGLGARFSKYINNNLLSSFILIEFILSIFVASSSLISYTTAAFTDSTVFIIYSLSIIIGFLIGLEIPLVIRLNDELEELKINISAVLEKDYYGSLAGGLFFSFFGLPYLGLTYTPMVLGSLNLIVAILLLIIVIKSLDKKSFKPILILGFITVTILVSNFIFADKILLFAEQRTYQDKVIYSEQSKYQKIVITQWKEDYWLFINGSQQLSSYDEVLYHEPIVHIPAYLSAYQKKALVFGGGDGCVARELLKYPQLEYIKLVDLDPAMTNLGRNHSVINSINNDALNSDKVKIFNQDAFTFAKAEKQLYDLIIIDLPDPKTPDLSRLYSREFYWLCNKILSNDGIIITQAGSPYYAPEAFNCIDNTLQSAGFATVPMHNQIMTLGEWGWILGSKSLSKLQLRTRLESAKFDNIETQFLNNSAVNMMINFGNNIFIKDSIQSVNTLNEPFLYQYYLSGDWKLY